MEYPEEIYATRDGGLLTSNAGACWGRRHAFDVGYGAGKTEQSDYIESMSSLESVLTDVEQLEGEDLPFVKRLIERTVRAVRAEQPDHLAGYSNLTAAIKAGEPIDWAKLDGKKVQCDNPDVGTNRGELGRNETYTSERSAGWFYKSMDKTYVRSLIDAWRGNHGWTLWVEGEIPLIRKTADQLDYYTYFYGHTPGEKPVMAYVGGRSEPWSGRRVHYAPCMATSLTRASSWVVLEEYGTSPKPEDK